ncbi:hypothetical protein ACIQVK_50285 [Streptomyces sp. NPDC090493]|uniref:hypothetical protein n=1 Tax=Streptomyces sp. NPDC090493 TaxID=3365964 RepID=UPI00381C3CED
MFSCKFRSHLYPEPFGEILHRDQVLGVNGYPPRFRELSRFVAAEGMEPNQRFRAHLDASALVPVVLKLFELEGLFVCSVLHASKIQIGNSERSEVRIPPLLH